MRTVYKYPVQGLEDFALALPVAHRVLHLDVQDGRPCFWAEVDTNTSTQVYRFHVVGTGHPVPSEALHVGTWQDGPFVWHLYRSSEAVSRG